MLVYIREAHALDSRVPNLQGPLIEDPITVLERAGAATQCQSALDLPFVAVIDGMDDATNRAYQGHPDRLYLVGKDGDIAFAGNRGPQGFDPDLLEEAIVAELKKISRTGREYF